MQTKHEFTWIICCDSNILIFYIDIISYIIHIWLKNVIKKIYNSQNEIK